MNGGTITFSFKGDTKQLDNAVDNVKKDTESKLGSIASTIGKAVAVGTASAVAGLTALTKASVNAFADFEQLEGGVKTIYAEGEKEIKAYEKFYGKSWEELNKEGFTTSAENLISYSKEAYKTAGVSANKYLEGVNSFGASLMASTKNNSQEAIEIANMAFQDMSDNANKMGSSLESIQTAYQGFAKGQYMLLDNLKLGYGGTKTEMERLLADASKISGVKYDIDNLADVYTAIHVIQEELKIAGTTADEAKTTISGSMGMVKASIENLMTAFGTGEGIEEVFNQTLDSIMIFAGNVAPVVERSINAIVDYIPKVADVVIKKFPSILQKILPKAIDLLVKIVNTLVETLPTLVPVLMDGILMLINAVVENLPTIITAIVSMLPVIAQGIANALPTLIPAIVQGIISLMQVFNDNMGLFLECGVKIIWGIIQGLINSIPMILENLPTIIMFIVNFFTAEKMLSAGKTLIVGLWNGLKNGIPTLLKNIPQLVGKVISAFKNGGNLKDVGINLIKGLWNGIGSVKDWIISKIGGFTQSVLKSIKSFFGIHSPSKVMADEVGQFLPKGMAVGIDANVDSVYNSIEDMQPEIEAGLSDLFNLSPQLTGSMNNSISPVINVNSDINVQTDTLGQVVKTIKTSSSGAKNDYSFGLGM